MISVIIKGSEKMAESKVENKGRKVSFFKGVQIEFKKIVWPQFNELVKSTFNVLVMALVIGTIVAGIDFIYGTLIRLILY